MKKKFDFGTLEKWEKNFLDNQNVPFLTTSAIVEITELEEFIADAKKMKADSVRVSFMRFTKPPGSLITDAPHGVIHGPDGNIFKGCVWLEAKPGLTQAAVALMPCKNFSKDEQFVVHADVIVEAHQVLTLIPGGSNGGPTGHNPPGQTELSSATD
jgi:hypothetical protein